MSGDSLGERFQGGNVLAGSHHLSHEEETDGGGEHVGGDAGEVVDVVLRGGELGGHGLVWEVVAGDGDGDGEEAGLSVIVGTVA